MNDLSANAVVALMLINVLVLIVIGVRVHSQSRELTSIGQRINDSSHEARDLERRLSKLEATVGTLPTHRDLRDLQENFTEVLEQVAVISGKAETMTGMLRTIQEYLLEREPRR